MVMKYEQLLQTSEPLPLRCTAQDKRMSEYDFETTKMTPEDYENIHNGPDYREVITTNNNNLRVRAVRE